MTQRDDADLFARFSRRLAGIEPDVEAPPPWRPPVERRAQDPRTRGRSHMAWSATKAAATVAIIALGAGFLVSNAPRQPQVSGQTAPAAESPSPAASIVPAGDRTVLATGTIGSCRGSGKDESEHTTPDSILQHRGGVVPYECSITMTDPRLTGTLSLTWNIDTFMRPDPSGTHVTGREHFVNWGTWLLTADDGTWEGDYTGSSTSAGSTVETGWLKGSGAYEGLSALFQVVGGLPVRGHGERDDRPREPAAGPMRGRIDHRDPGSRPGS